ncbi:MAG TPA: Fe-S cluster assembly protein HesB, partial [Anaeromyxobacteraceae bacterium]
MDTPHPFSLDLTVRSHGFWDLAPWSYDRERQLLARPLRLRSGRVIDVEVAPRDAEGGGLALRLTTAGRLSAPEGREVRAQVRTCLALDEDLAPFHAKLRASPALAWAADRGAGRLLRSPTVFEDAVKTLCTT